MITFKPLKLYLEENEISYTQLAMDTGLSLETMEKVSKEKCVSLLVIKKICDAYNLKPQDVIQYVDDETGLVPKPILKHNTYSATMKKKIKPVNEQTMYQEAKDIDYGPLFEIMKKLDYSVGELSYWSGVSRSVLKKDRKSKMTFRSITAIADELNVPIACLYIDRQHPERFISYKEFKKQQRAIKRQQKINKKGRH